MIFMELFWDFPNPCLDQEMYQNAFRTVLEVRNGIFVPKLFSMIHLDLFGTILELKQPQYVLELFNKKVDRTDQEFFWDHNVNS